MIDILKYNYRQRLGIFLFIAGIFYIIGGMVSIALLKESTTNHLRIATFAQDIIIFILPAIVTAIYVSTKPDRFLMIDKFPEIKSTVIAIAILIASIPLMNKLIEWNQNLHLPDSMSTIELKMKEMENAAQATVSVMLGDLKSWKSFVISIIIVGFMAGLSEELFFRGTMQRLLASGKLNKHLAIWFTAFIFSALHFQFFGFIPRLVLGALFGYLAFWSGNLWVPIIVHMINNSLVVASEFELFDSAKETIEKTDDSGSNLLVISASFLATVFLIALFIKTSQKKEKA